MKPFFPLILSSLLWMACADSQSQMEPQLIGSCEGCEAVFEYGDRILSSTDTLPDFHEDGTRIKVSGTVYQSDGKTPAEDVILYVYHTNQDGIYAPGEEATDWEQKHGYIRTWLETGSDGRYSFYTLKPGAYPSGSEPAHIHLIILEPTGTYYWLDSYHFSGDSLLTEKERNPRSPRGGSSGLLQLKSKGDLLVGTRDIILGKNVPGYE